MAVEITLRDSVFISDNTVSQVIPHLEVVPLVTLEECHLTWRILICSRGRKNSICGASQITVTTLVNKKLPAERERAVMEKTHQARGALFLSAARVCG